MILALPTKPVARTGKRRTIAHVHHRDPAQHGFRYIDVPTYPQEAVEASERFRALRVELGLSLRGAATILGLWPAEYGDLEHGRRTCDFAEAERRLRAAKDGAA